MRNSEVNNAWLQEDQAFDKAMSEALANIPIPETLRDDILTAVNKTQANRKKPKKNNPLQFPLKNWWRNSTILSIAATLIVFLSMAAMFTDPIKLSADQDIPDFHAACIKHTRANSQSDFKSDQLSHLQAYLKNERALAPTSTPKNLNLAGASTFRWQNEPVSRLRFDDETAPYHLYMIDTNIFGDNEAFPSKPVTKVYDDYQTTTWVEGKQLYVLVAPTPTDSNDVELVEHERLAI